MAKQSLDDLEEKHEGAAIKLEHYQLLEAQYYNSMVHNRQFQVDDRVLYRVFQHTHELNA